ncbi:MAG: bifunctional riboflavin kinase/FAD synthetase [Candidatus Eremiobacteraeota bacterium]|nr:bifunctional riboflavin kinase/FAD synthetase [Candidatus Eremiobacteraeota bacterium]
MKIHHELKRDHTRPPLVLAIGFFDGFHRGHQAIVRELRKLRKPGYRTGVVTFSNHPAAFLRPGTEPPLLTTTEERIDLLARAGVEECFLVPFDDRIASLSPQAFVDDVLDKALGARAVVVGTNFRFGKGRAGDINLARETLASHNIPFLAIENTAEAGERISSTRIRALLTEGKTQEAEELLGHAFELRGVVRLGEGRGHDLGFPTANIELGGEKLLPKDGVYAGTARHDGRDHAALVSIGTNPTFDGKQRTVEAWLRDFAGTIYGEELVVRELRFVRDQVRYDSVEALLAQMQKDLRAVAYPSYG